jgi:ABC-type uncharacterized transport system permease subunit
MTVNDLNRYPGGVCNALLRAYTSLFVPVACLNRYSARLFTNNHERKYIP